MIRKSLMFALSTGTIGFVVLLWIFLIQLFAGEPLHKQLGLKITIGATALLSFVVFFTALNFKDIEAISIETLAVNTRSDLYFALCISPLFPITFTYRMVSCYLEGRKYYRDRQMLS